MEWFTADFHLGHKKILKYCNRPFSSAEEMDNLILTNLNLSLVKGDTLYYLGDLSFGIEPAKRFINIIHNKSINLVFFKGNHDKGDILNLLKTNNIPILGLKTITIHASIIVLCHYSMRVWDRSHFNSFQLYAHSHGTLPSIGKQHDIGVDNNNFAPISYTSLLEIMKNKPNNFNYIENKRR